MGTPCAVSVTDANGLLILQIGFSEIRKLLILPCETVLPCSCRVKSCKLPLFAEKSR